VGKNGTLIDLAIMVNQGLAIIKGTCRTVEPARFGAVVDFQELKQSARNGRLLKHLFAYPEARLFTPVLPALPKPLLTALLLRVLSRRRCHWQDDSGLQQEIRWREIFLLFRQAVSDARHRTALLRQVRGLVETLTQRFSSRQLARLGARPEARPVYLRTDLSFGITAGGSLGHMAGVLNNLHDAGGRPMFLTTDLIPGLREQVEVHQILPDGRFRDFNELPSLHFNQVFCQAAGSLLQRAQPYFIYQRYGLNNFSGAKLADDYSVPFVLEFNGSEVWIHKNWGTGLRYEPLSQRIEDLDLQAADVIVVVSHALKHSLLSVGVDERKVLVNPNGVDPERYHPAVDGSVIRERLALGNSCVIGFIGTFGRWHGAEVLAEAFGKLLQQHPEYRDKVRLLMIGDGPMMPKVKACFRQFESSSAVLTGLVPQEEGPRYLAACDILVSPHVPNPDGTPFFGSPTKLFEYMAMGKGIVASHLDQIGEILKHGETAWMVEPGDSQSLTAGLKKLVDDSALRERLGAAAREVAVARHTWKEHTRRIVEKLKERCG